MRGILQDAVALSRIRTHEPKHDNTGLSDLPTLPLALLSAEKHFLEGNTATAPEKEVNQTLKKLTDCSLIERVNDRLLVNLSQKVTEQVPEFGCLLPERNRRLGVSLHDVMAVLNDGHMVDLNKLQASKATAFIESRRRFETS
jgi:hypothetical protein